MGQFSNTHLENRQLYFLGWVGYSLFNEKNSVFLLSLMNMLKVLGLIIHVDEIPILRVG
jgi:hypothetical protein